MSGPLARRPAAALFDWDNTLVDTWPVIHEAMNAALQAMGQRAWTLEETHARVRRAMRETFPLMFGTRADEARTIFYERFHAIHLERLVVREGAEALLDQLAGDGVYLAVVSNKQGENLRRESAHLGWDRYFGRLVGASDAGRDKPAVEPVELALAGSGLARGPDVWFVGDTGVDLECAHNAGLTPVLVREAPPGPGEFEPYPPAAHFFSCDALADLVRALRRF